MLKQRTLPHRGWVLLFLFRPWCPRVEKEWEKIELMSVMLHLNKLYQTDPKLIPQNMSLISALENYFGNPYQNPLLFIYHFLWPWCQRSENYPPQGSNYSSLPSVLRLYFVEGKQFTSRTFSHLLFANLQLVWDQFNCAEHRLRLKKTPLFTPNRSLLTALRSSLNKYKIKLKIFTNTQYISNDLLLI